MQGYVTGVGEDRMTPFERQILVQSQIAGVSPVKGRNKISDGCRKLSSSTIVVLCEPQDVDAYLKSM